MNFEQRVELLEALQTMLHDEFGIEGTPRLRSALAHVAAYIPEDALQDVLQLLWVEMWTGDAGPMDESAAIRAFNRIAKRLQRVAAKGPLPLPKQELPDTAGSDPTLDVEQREEVQHLLMSLPQLTREIVELRMQGLSTEEIAKELERSRRTILLHLEQAFHQWERRAAGNE